MDKLLRRILAVLLVLSLVTSLTQSIPLNNLEPFYQNVMFKANKEFEMMLDNWASDYTGLFSGSKPIECPSNATDENGNLKACVIPTENKENVANTQANDELKFIDLNNKLGDKISLSVNNTVLSEFYDRLRFVIQDPLPLPDKSKLRHLTNFLIMYGLTKDVMISGLSKYTVKELNSNVSSFSISSKFHWDHINLTGLYELDISGPRIHLYGNGPFSINVTDILFGFNIGIGENNNGTLHLDKFEIDFNVGDVSTKLENFLDGGAAGDAANDFLGEILPTAVSFAMPQFKDTLEKRTLEYANIYLHDIYAQNVTNFLKRYVTF
ncbi:uncharacterized protein LOC142332982 [Lycorma delicatula]|uniref:uncharacterized protein LOC142332982 n=1 Tax=Lycorma delicatula TaxID=130591 RepID=UPI003F5122C5